MDGLGRNKIRQRGLCRISMMNETQTFSRAVIRKAMESKCWVYRKGNKYRVVPRSMGHGKYELSYTWNGDVPEVTECVDFRTGEGCKGFTYSKQCYHAMSLCLHLLKRKIRGNKANSVLVFHRSRTSPEAVASR